MAQRALIIAIEQYPQMPANVGVLPDTLKAGEAFRDWVIAKWNAEGVDAADRELVFCSEPQIAGGKPADVRAIRDVLRNLRTSGQNGTEVLYFFFSGHGFTFSDGRDDLTDYLMTSESTGPDDPVSCLPFDHLVTWLRNQLGPGRHFHFVDACRNVLTVANADPGPLGINRVGGAAGEPATFALQSTYQGAVAAVSTQFPAALIGGLKGAGKSKVYDDNVPNAMFVHYGSLRAYVNGTMQGQKAIGNTTGDVSESAAVLLTLTPIPTIKCTVKVDNLDPGDNGTVLVRRERGPIAQRVVTRVPMTGAVTILPLEPDRYSIGVEMAGAAAAPAAFVAVEVFDDVVAPTFTKSGPGGAGAPVPPPPPSPAPPPPPSTMRGGIGVGGGAPAPRAEWDVSLPHRSIAAMFPHSSQGVDFSESLGELRDMDLDVWLAILGGGRIMPDRVGDYSKIATLPLYDFSTEAPGASPVYVLAAMDEETSLEVSVSDGVTPQWQLALPVAGMPGVQHLHVPAALGQKLISLRMPEVPTRTFVSLTSPNRATLVTITIGRDRVSRLWQYLLPLGHLIQQLPPSVRGQVKSRSNPLQDLRNLAAAGRAFRRRRDMGTELNSGLLEDLFHSKWVDPIGSALAAYQALRLGAKDRVGHVAENMLKSFPELPDSHALAALAGIPGATPQGVPLFLDGLLAFPDEAIVLPYPESRLDMAGPWTAWRRAV